MLDQEYLDNKTDRQAYKVTNRLHCHYDQSIRNMNTRKPSHYLHFRDSFTTNASLTLLTGIFLSHLMVAMALAVVFTLAFESPFVKLEKLVIGALLQGGAGGGGKKAEQLTEKKKPV